MTLTWRALRDDDQAAWLELRATVEASDATGENVGPTDFAALMTPDAGIDTVAAFDGELMVGVGVASFREGATDVDGVGLEGHVRPSHRRQGVGRELLARSAECAQKWHAANYPDLPMELRATVHEANVGNAALLSSAGYAPTRWWYDMAVDLAVPATSFALPDGFTAAPYTLDVAERVRLARNESFADHWGSTPADPRRWHAHTSGHPGFAADRSAVAWDGATGEVAAYVLVYDAPDGLLWIGQVGTRPGWRGRGLAAALLSVVIDGAREAGYRSAGLAVDTGNATGALGVYERVGLRVTERWTTYTVTR